MHFPFVLCFTFFASNSPLLPRITLFRIQRKSQGCHIFLAQLSKTGKMYQMTTTYVIYQMTTICIYQMTTKYTKWLQNIPKDHNIPNDYNIYQMATKYVYQRTTYNIYQMTTKYTKWPQNIPNGHKMQRIYSDEIVKIVISAPGWLKGFSELVFRGLSWKSLSFSSS
jgi:hypothetical protein